MQKLLRTTSLRGTKRKLKDKNLFCLRTIVLILKIYQNIFFLIFEKKNCFEQFFKNFKLYEELPRAVINYKREPYPRVATKFEAYEWHSRNRRL